MFIVDWFNESLLTFGWGRFEGNISERLQNYIFSLSLIFLNISDLTKFDRLANDSRHIIHKFLSIQGGSHKSYCCILTDRIVQSIEGSSKETRMIANVWRSSLINTSSKLNNGAASWKKLQCA